MLAVKRIFRYLIGTINLGLWYPRGPHIDLICYSNADFAGYKVDRKSTSETCHFLSHSLISWFSKKQNTVTLSTTEVEYIAVGSFVHKPFRWNKPLEIMVLILIEYLFCVTILVISIYPRISFSILEPSIYKKEML